MRFRSIVAIVLLIAMGSPAIAGTHTWVPRMHILSDGTPDFTLPFVSITGSGTTFGPGEFDLAFNDPIYNPWAANGIAAGIYAQKSRALGLANSCSNPAISQNAKNVTGGSDGTDRWLAAQEMFNSIQQTNLWSMYRNALNITVIINNTSYTGFKVTYKDGASEVWAVNPGWATSVVKLVDQPMPDSLKPGAPGTGCMT